MIRGQAQDEGKLESVHSRARGNLVQKARSLQLPPPSRFAAHLPRERGRKESSLLIEGYASLFGVADSGGDVVRAGAFARSLKRGGVPMLLQHRSGAVAGRWVRMIEDGRGLYVRGLVEGREVRALVESGLDGLSIGFRPRVWTPRPSSFDKLRMRDATPGGRTLADVDLVEVSLVAEPMLGAARFRVV